MYNSVFDQNDRRVRRYQPGVVKAHRFQQGDSVQYNGGKESLKSLSNKEGLVCGRVGGSDHDVVVSFGDDAYIMNELSDLVRFVKKEKPEHVTESKGPEVVKRKGVAGEDGSRRGGKRRKEETT
jgi:hypothetical protein